MKIFKSDNKNNNKKLAINKNITSLELNYPLILPGVLTELSTRLPSLANLYFRNCFFQERVAGQEFDGQSSVIVIDMPKTSFYTITWYLDLHVQEDYLSYEL